MKRLERLGEARSPDGTLLTLDRHDGAYLIRADGVELMSTRRHLSEDRLAELACEPIRDRPNARVLVGGLGLGFTLKAALRVLGDDAEVVVAELLDAVIAWNGDEAYGISVEAMRDPRTRIVHDDVMTVLRDNAGGFDAIMLDVDNGPEGMILAENERLYSPVGVEITRGALRPGGQLVYWSVGEDAGFERQLKRAGLNVEPVRVRAHDTSGPMHVLFVVRGSRGD